MELAYFTFSPKAMAEVELGNWTSEVLICEVSFVPYLTHDIVHNALY